MTWACACAADKRSSRGASNTYAKKSKRLGIGILPIGRLENGHLHILEYLVERKYDKYDEWACQYAARNGHLDCLKYLHETAKAPWNCWRRTRSAHENNHPECLQYLLDNNCPSTTQGWRYEHGELTHDLESSGHHSSTKKEYEKGKQLPFSNARNTRI